MITQEQIETLSHQFQIDQYSILREYLQLLFLKYFYELRQTERVCFKGGTAIHFLYRSFRFSEDLDFTSLLSQSELQELTKNVARRLNQELSGIELKKIQSHEHGFSQILKYNYELRHPLTIRLEFSLREKPLTREASAIETAYPIAGYPFVTHLGMEELLAEKIRALLTRSKGRDLFDLWFLLTKGTRLKEEYVKNKMRWRGKAFRFKDLIRTLEHFPQRDLEGDLNKFLPKNYRPIISELKDKTLKELALGFKKIKQPGLSL